MCKLPHAFYRSPKLLALRAPEIVMLVRTAYFFIYRLCGGHRKRAAVFHSISCQKCKKRHDNKPHLEDDKNEKAFANNVLIDEENVDNLEIREKE